ncbi:MAG: acyl-CoA dehydrogenase [Deltaproteobacteria bacterium]|nr:acyl-CoA dehydrogenase [Deltaproteobacteria bacterium]
MLRRSPYGPATVLAQETLAALSPSLYLCAETAARIFGRLLHTYGDSAIQSEILPALTRGELIGAVAFSEAGFDETIADMETVGRPAADGFEVTGKKVHAVNGPISDWIAVAGKMDTEDRPVFFLLKRGSPGLSTGSRHRTLGYNSVAASGISLDACQVSSNNIIGPTENGDLFSTVRLWENQVLATAGLGLMQRAFDAAVGHAKAYQSAGKPLIAYQEVGFKLAEMLTLVQTARLLIYRAAWMAEADEHEAETLAHCAKVFCTESAEEVNSKALQILGETGFIRRNPAEQGYRNARYLQIAGTASELSRMKIGDGLLDFH